MVSTIKKILVFAFAVMALIGCKQNEWLDWKVQNELWLVNNAKQSGIITTPTGLQYRVIQSGVSPTSARPDENKLVTIQYTGKLINGFEFDGSDSYADYVSNFVSGFQEGLGKMHEFDEIEMYIPYDLGYGTDGYGTEGYSTYIPPYSTLIFRVYLKAVN